MKQILFSISLLVLFAQLLIAQDSLTQNHIVYKIKAFNFQMGIKTGYLRSITDSALFLTFPIELAHSAESQFQKLHYTDLSRVQLQRTGMLGNGIAIGGISGGATGALFGYILYELQQAISFGYSQQPARALIGQGHW